MDWATVGPVVIALLGGGLVSAVITGLVAQITGSLQTGLVVLCLITAVGVVAGVLYPSHKPSPSPN